MFQQGNSEPFSCSCTSSSPCLKLLTSTKKRKRKKKIRIISQTNKTRDSYDRSFQILCTDGWAVLWGWLLLISSRRMYLKFPQNIDVKTWPQPDRRHVTDIKTRRRSFLRASRKKNIYTWVHESD
ncbi:hypothetical protein L211DRAFT_198266 [Terfezia boudieri ATCC MYA-4762]|uniref:Uncharacterized protein n=1 Tax=Terfezia boudieri ATCC MYA-4762 TaxID=1051890 RepID=A0A3N4LM19_9PEZI|nr:hypothetical protein L211DRAFT_198266 [Terfezia boudieri ATCC MYA-4762]